MNIAIVVTTYNRPESLKRLLNSIKNANYANYEVPLYISIDKCSDIKKNKEVLAIAEEFEWEQGPKFINSENENLGLKKHILKCGDLTYTFENIILLEDDIYVDTNFYMFAKQALEYYIHDERIAGISLYNHEVHQSTGRPFLTLNEDNDVYFLQYAQSWGQVWSKKWWSLFQQWLQSEKNEYIASEKVPYNVNLWPESSWLKFHIKYVIDTDKYFVYPRVSLTTNFTDCGTHNQVANSDYQVRIQYKKNYDYRFVTLDECEAVYNGFFENIRLSDFIEKEYGIKNVELDLFGVKDKKYNGDFVLTTKIFRNVPVVKTFGLKLRPHELNILFDIPGNEIFLYDVRNIRISTKSNNLLRMQMNHIKYDLKGLNKKGIFLGNLYNIFTIAARRG